MGEREKISESALSGSLVALIPRHSAAIRLLKQVVEEQRRHELCLVAFDPAASNNRAQHCP